MHHFIFKTRFLPLDAMHSADYAVERCPSVCPSVCLSHDGIVSKRLNVSSNFFHYRVAHVNLDFPYQMLWQYPNGDGQCGRTWKNRDLSRKRYKI